MRRTGTVGRYGAVLATLLMMGLAPAQAVPPVSACYDAYAAGRWSDTLRNCTLWASKGDPEAQPCWASSTPMGRVQTKTQLKPSSGLKRQRNKTILEHGITLECFTQMVKE